MFGYANASGAWSDIALSGDTVVRSGSQHVVITAKSASGAIKFATGSADTAKMTILNGGNVGIGTTSPSSILGISAVDARISLTETVGGGTYLVGNNRNTIDRFLVQPTTSFAPVFSIAQSGSGVASGAILEFFGVGAPGSGNEEAFRIMAHDPLGITGTDDVVIDTAALGTGVVRNMRFRPGGTQALYLGTNGNVGVGTTNPQTALQVAGVISPATDNTDTLGSASYRFTSIYATNNVINTSDGREKKDIQPSDFGLDFINKLRPVSYRWKKGDDVDLHYGLIAQETEKVVADLKQGSVADPSNIIVAHDKKTDRYGIKYTELISPVIKAIQELYNRLLSTEAQVATLDRAISSLTGKDEAKDQRIQKLEQENAELKAYLCAKDRQAPICK